MRYTRLNQVAAVATLLTYAYYLGYRLLFTINTDALAFSLAFFYAELHGFVALLLYFFQMWSPTQRTAPPPAKGLSVDVFIPTYNEEIPLLRKTVLACLAMRYPHQTYILDDGRRPDCEALARELGCRYLARDGHAGAKAGNLNHALRQTKGELIVVFDADSVPRPEFLERTLGYFADGQVALVQVPQQYYNTDSFTFNLDPEKKKSWNEHDVFYRLIMPGRDYWDSAFFVGTGAVLRRRALEQVGGFAEGTITEDLHTTLKLYKRGWKGLYHNEVLAVGLGAMDLATYQSQHERWGEGNVSILFHDNPLFEKGLSPAQRLCFGATVFSWAIGFPKLIYFSAPSVMLLTGMYPIANFASWQFIATYLVYMATVIAGFKIVSRGYGRVFDDEAYNMLNFYSFIRAVVRSLARNCLGRASRFIVTSKSHSPGTITASPLGPQILLALISYAAVVWGAMKLCFGATGDFLGYGVAIFWAAANGLLAFSVVRRHLRLPSGRRLYRFVDSFPVAFRAPAAQLAGTAAAEEGLGCAANFNEAGLALLTFEPLPRAAELDLELLLPGQHLACRGEVVHRNHVEGDLFYHGIRFQDLGQAQADAIVRYCFNQAWPRFFAPFENRHSFFTRLLFSYENWRRFRRRSRRREYNLPLWVESLGRPLRLAAAARNLSRTGIAFLSGERLEVGEELALKVASPLGVLSFGAEVKRLQPQGGAYLCGAAFTRNEGDSSARLEALLDRYQRI